MKELPKSLGDSWLKRIVALYGKLYYKKYAVKHSASFAVVGKLFKPLIKEHGEVLVGLCILLHFEYKGTNDDNMSIFKNLSDNAFPLLWVPKRVPEYLAFLKNYAEIDLTNDEEMLAMLKERLESLDIII